MKIISLFNRLNLLRNLKIRFFAIFTMACVVALSYGIVEPRGCGGMDEEQDGDKTNKNDNSTFRENKNYFNAEIQPISNFAIDKQEFYNANIGYGIEWEPFEIQIPLSKIGRLPENPYDENEIKIDLFLTKPNGKNILPPTPCFYSKEYNILDNFTAIKNPEISLFKCRFTPREHGKYLYTVKRFKKPSPETLLSGNIIIKKSRVKNDGFIRINNSGTFNLFYFSKSGRVFYPIGGTINHALGPQNDRDNWTELPPDPERLSLILERLKIMADNGVNFVIFFMDSWKVPLESMANDISGYEGVGRYHGQVSFEFDKILQYAKKRGIRVQLCISNANYIVNNIDIFSDVADSWRIPFNIFHINNGGPLRYGYEITGSNANDAYSLPEFWTDQAVKELVKNKFRYVIARWGYSPNIFAWEFLTELDMTRSWDSTYVDNVVKWYDEVANYAKSIDPNNHLITSTIAEWNDPNAVRNRLLELPNLDIVEYHTPNIVDYAEHLPQVTNPSSSIDKPQFEASYNLPEGAGEYSIYGHADPSGIHIHNALWSSVLSGHSAAAVPWYVGKRAINCLWDNLVRSNCIYEDGYLEKNNLYIHHKILRKFVDTFNYPKSNLQKVSYSNLRYSDGQPIDDFLDLPIDNIVAHWRVPEKITFDVPVWGNLESERLIEGRLWGNGMPSYHKQITFNTNYHEDGQFIVHVNKAVRDHSNYENILTISLDGNVVKTKSYSPGASEIIYDDDVGIDIPAGVHSITIENTGNGDILIISSIIFKNYAYPLRILGQANSSSAYLWIQNKRHTIQQKLRSSVLPTKLDISDLTKGTYQVSFFSTYKLKKKTNTLHEITRYNRGNGSVLTIDIPEVENDILCVITKIY